MDWVSLTCCLLAFLLYYNTLDAGFVYDDRRAILSNPDLLPSTPWRNLLENDFWGTPLTDSGSHGSYRPLCVFTFRLNYLLGGFQPWGYHLVNVLLHCLATALVVRVARAILPPSKTKLGSAIAGLTFASHPIHTEAVAGVVGRADLAACNFYLLSFLVYVAHVKYRDTSNYNVTFNNLPLNGCCVQRCLSRINGVNQVKKTFKKPVEHTSNGAPNGHIVTNGYVAENDILSRSKGSFLYNAERSNYHNILFHLIDNIRQCNWFGKMEDFTASGGIICVVKFFISCGLNTWHMKKGQCTNINNNNINGDVKRNCHSEGSNGIVNTALLNGNANHNGGYHQNGVVNGVKCQRGDEEKLESGAVKLCAKCRAAGAWGWKCHGALFCCILLAAAATLSKETGVTALAACALYDLLRAAQDATWNNKRRIVSLGMLFAALIALLAARVPLSASPKFARADNPTAKEPSIVTRFLTFYYLPVFNFFLLICPSTLSFDWSMDAVPRVTSLMDPRNFLTISFYYITSKLLYKSTMAVYRQGETKNKQLNLRKDNNKIHAYGYQKNGFNGGRCLKVNRNGLIYQFNSLCGYTSVIKSGRVLVSSSRIGTKTVCHCSCCKHLLTDHHSNSCRAVNNNNSMTAHSTCTCPPLVSVASVRPPIDKPKAYVRKSSHSALLVAASFLTLPFLPATNLFFYVGFVVAERVLYLPSVGFSLLVGIGGAKVGSRLGSRARVAALGALLLALSARTLVRNRDWRDEESLYRSAVKINPPKAFGNLGSVLSGLGRVKEAEVAFHEALRHRPNMADVHYNLGVLLQSKRQYEEAIQCFERAIHFRPSLALAYVNMGASLSALGRCAEAASALSRAARLDGTGVRDARAHAHARTAALQHLGALHAAQGRSRRALQEYQQALAARPPDYRPQKLYALMSEALGRLQRWPEADRYREAAIASEYSPTVPASPARWRVRDAENRFKRTLKSLSTDSKDRPKKPKQNSLEHKKYRDNRLEKLGHQIIAARNKERRKIKSKLFSAIINEPGMIVSNCRPVETPKSCCT